MSQVNIAARYKAIRIEESRLADEKPDERDFWMVSEHDETRDMHGGVIVQVTRYRAAEAVVDKTHRMATPEEIEKHLTAEKKVRDRAEELAIRRELLMSPVVQQLNPTPPARASKGDSNKA